MASDTTSIVIEEKIKAERAAALLRVTHEDKNQQYQKSWAESINNFGTRESPLNIIRVYARAAMTSINSVLNPAGAFNAIKTQFEYAELFGRGIQDFLSSLIALDRMVIYQMQRVQNYRMNYTLGAIRNACGDLEDLNSNIQAIADSFGADNNLDFLVDDFEDRFKRANIILGNAYDEDSGFVDDDWKDGEKILEEISYGNGETDDLLLNFRKLSNAVNGAKRKVEGMGPLWETLNSSMADSGLLLDNIKEGTRLKNMLKRALSISTLNTKDGKDILSSLKSGCRDDPNKVFNGLGVALSKSDAALIALDKSRFDNKLGDFNLNNITVDSDCLLVRYKAYLDDLELLQRMVPDIDRMAAEQRAFLDAAVVYAVKGTEHSKNVMNSAYTSTQENKTLCRSFSDSAEGVFNSWNDSSSEAGEGMLGVLGDMADMGDSTNSALGMILGARVFTLDTFEEFLNMTPIGRMLLTVATCLGVSDELLGADTLNKSMEVKTGLEGMTTSIEKLSQNIAEIMNSVFGYLDGVDSDVAEFIAALAGLLKFCDGNTALQSPGIYGTSIASQSSMDLYSDSYNASLGGADNGTTDAEVPPTLGGCLK